MTSETEEAGKPAEAEPRLRAVEAPFMHLPEAANEVDPAPVHVLHAIPASVEDLHEIDARVAEAMAASGVVAEPPTAEPAPVARDVEAAHVVPRAAAPTDLVDPPEHEIVTETAATLALTDVSHVSEASTLDHIAEPAAPATEPSTAAVAEPQASIGPASRSSQEWPLSWLRLVEPEPEPEPEPAAAAEPEPESHADVDPVSEAAGDHAAQAPPAEHEMTLAYFAAPAIEALHFHGEAESAAHSAVEEIGPHEATETHEAARVSTDHLTPYDVDEALALALEQEAFARTGSDADQKHDGDIDDTREAKALKASKAKADVVAPETTAEPEDLSSALVVPSYVARTQGKRRPAAKARPTAPKAPSAAKTKAQPQAKAQRAPEAALEGKAGEGGIALIVYMSYLLSFLAVPAILGVAVAYNARKTAPAWLQSHYLFQIRTFWIGCAGSIMGAAMVFSGRLTIVGLLLWLALVVWTEMRSALGFINIVKLKSYPRPRDWMI